MMNTKKKISFILAVLMSVSLLATGCKKTDEESTGLPDTTPTTVSELTQMTTAAPETTTAAPETTVPETEETTVSETEETTVSETEATTTTASETTTAAPETTKAETAATTKRDWNETEISEVMYTSQACYSRIKPVVGSDPVSQYKKGTKVNVVAATDTGYYKLADGSFIHSDYLVEEKPAAVTTAKVTTAKDTDEEIFDDDTGDTEETTSASKPAVVAGDYKSRYGYKTLTSAQKKLYDNIYEAVSNFNTKVTVPDGLLSDDIAKVYGMVFNQEPQFFWMSTKVPGGYGTLTLKYEMTAEEAAIKQKEIDKNVNSILATASKSKTTAGKLKVFYDWIILHNTFSLSETAATCSISNGLTGSIIQCAGYAKSMQYLCDKAGIESMVVVGRNSHGSSHAWNVVYCEDGYYVLDTAWGDSEESEGEEQHIRYTYFLVPDKWATNTHFEINKFFKSNGSSIKYFDPPSCTKTSQNYFKLYGKLYSDFDSAEKAMYDEIDKAIKNGNCIAEIRVTDQAVFDKLTTNSCVLKFQKYAKSNGNVAKFSRQKIDNEAALILQFHITYE